MLYKSVEKRQCVLIFVAYYKLNYHSILIVTKVLEIVLGSWRYHEKFESNLNHVEKINQIPYQLQMD